MWSVSLVVAIKVMSIQLWSRSKHFCFAANGPIWIGFRSENAHVSLLHSAFRASSITNQPHFRLKQKYLDMLIDFAKETQKSVNKVQWYVK